ncbi:glycosyltransferase family 39 protein [Candidatus Woesearchaeota archaeon]|nr:glycosyltransferase family 39 protein [Candidatus Woesearchaeota archaeon]
MYLDKLLVALLALFLIAQALLPTHALGWDESVYVGMGKQMLTTGTSGIWESFRPPLLPLVLGLWWLFGFPFHILTLFWSVLAIVMVYLITKELMDRRAGLFAAVLIILYPIFFSEAAVIMTEIPATTLMLVSLYCFSKQCYSLSGFSAGLAFLFKFPAGLIIIPLTVALFMQEQRSRKLSTILLCFLLVITPYLIFNLWTTGSFLKPIIDASLHQNNYMHAAPGWHHLTYYLELLVTVHPLLILAIVGLWMNQVKHRWLLGGTAMLFFIYLTIIINKQPRFSLLFIPLLVVLAGIGIEGLSRRFRKRQFIGVSVILFLAFIPLSKIGYLYQSSPASIEQTAFFQKIGSQYKTILTNDPRPTGVSDARFIPYYFEIETAAADYTAGRPQANAILYTPEAFPCEQWKPTEQEVKTCMALKKELEIRIEKENRFLGQFGSFMIYEPR